MAEQTIRAPLASGSALRARFADLAATRGYDVVVRVVFICWIVFLAVPSAHGVVLRVRVHPGSWDPALLAELLARGATLLFFVLAALVRHPLYVAEEIAAIGLFLQHASLATALLFIAHLASQLQRMRHEEQVLRATFPEYEAYAARTRRLIPGVY
ncbi:MAG: Isoprenylcysteine carboxyl methyltransferase [Geminicoccaceae bacterium]|nr:Isoprenylcysteine carboxyl methyltransferase [Geminicoccaceae bacterium]